MRMRDKVAIVTGAASGIGHAIATLFAKEGAVVYAVDIAAMHFDESRIHAVTHDVTSARGWQALVERVLAEQDNLSVLVNNAGIVGPYDDVVSTDMEAYERVIAINQTAVFLGMKHCIPAMQAGGAGAIVNVSSMWGIIGVEGVAAYQASKGAVRCMSKNAAVTYAPAVRVNSLHPGLTWTPMIEKQDPALRQRQIDGTPMGRMAQPIELAYAALFLACDESSYVTGIELLVDGGHTAK